MFGIDLGAILIYVIVGLLAGLIANVLSGRRSDSALQDILLGIAGSLLGDVVLSFLGVYHRGLLGDIVTATVGALLIIFLMRTFAKNAPPAS